MAGCVFGYFADCSSAIVFPNCSTAFVPNYGCRNAQVQVTSMGFVTGLAFAEKPTFHNVFIM